MIDLTIGQYCVMGTLFIPPLYVVGSGIKKLITGKSLPGTKVAAQISLVELIVGLAVIVPGLADTNLDKTYGIEKLVDTAKATLPPYNLL